MRDRFKKEILIFAGALEDTANKFQNQKKPSDIRRIPLDDIIAKYREEKREMEQELCSADHRRLKAEILDLGLTLVMLYAKRSQIELTESMND